MNPQTITNQFGTGEMYSAIIEDKVYPVCTACMSILAEFGTWMNAHQDRWESSPKNADAIAVLGCQVTDLAVLNDLWKLNELQHQWPDKVMYVGGCLSRRFDIPLPAGVRRLSNVSADDYCDVLPDWEKPFWVQDFQEENPSHWLDNGHLFRDMYPLRIGVGCKHKCAYCSIRITRGPFYEVPVDIKRIKEFLIHDNVVLIADSPTTEQLTKWAQLALKHNRPLSIRNVEPQVTVSIFPVLLELARRHLLKVYHSPIQSDKEEVLKDMCRDVVGTRFMLNRLIELRRLGTTLATNVIIDYKDFPNPDMEALNQIFHYVSWNPYWDGKWDEAKAITRWKKYFPWSTRYA